MFYSNPLKKNNSIRRQHHKKWKVQNLNSTIEFVTKKARKYFLSYLI